MRTKSLAWILSLFFVFTIFVLTICGASQSRQGPSQKIDGTVAPPEMDENRTRAERDMVKRANQERQAVLKGDTDRLVKLAGELKDYVDKSNENILSVEVLKKAEEIEKLAHSVKEKMKGPN